MDLIKQHFGVLELDKWFATETCLGHRRSTIMAKCSSWVRFRTYVIPGRAGNRTPRNRKTPQNVWSDRLHNGFNYFQNNVLFKQNNAFKHVPELFWRTPGPENRGLLVAQLNPAPVYAHIHTEDEAAEFTQKSQYLRFVNTSKQINYLLVG